MKTSLQSGLACLVAGFTLNSIAAPVAPMHGAMELPISRQLACYNAGDFNWPTDGSGIKSPGCKAAYQHVYKKYGEDAQQAVYQFNQWHEVSKNVKDYKDMDEVKKAIPDGQLCSAGNDPDQSTTGILASIRDLLGKLGWPWSGFKLLANDKSGLDVPADWEARTLTTYADGKVKMRYKIQAVHNPSYWEIYVSKPGYDPKERALKWDDLVLVDEIGDVPPVNGYYELDVDLKGNEGRRVIYSRWQRVDPAGEGFYNCSDVNIVSSK
ncbi:lytic polysaccharide monooxygenase [Pseudomonas vlassakiae]|uniref:lytic polysaccharide monooxygenase n=1 Tax=Pseudomonas vlassakiae TaxID=485888 RepID=UPI0021C64A28|nr:lytic polysaccharide monooxygenase [Pseudomonas vlassakiae]MCU0123568.1 lytic polysaccharide monooxygenase [Pseudomonas vlassakiae]